LRAFVFAACLSVALVPCASPARSAVVTIVCGAIAESYEPCRSGSEAWAVARGHEVKVLRYGGTVPQNRATLAQLLDIGDRQLDVVEVEAAWISTIQSHLVDLKPRLGRDISENFATAVLSFTRDGEVFAAPWFIGVGRLFYRADLLAWHALPVPKTWEELAAVARSIQEAERAAGNDGFWGFIWPGRVSESLTVDAIEWTASRGVAPLLAPNGTPTVSDRRVAVALSQAASWVGTISPGEVLEMDDREAVRRFMAGEAAFLRYWSLGSTTFRTVDSPVSGRVAAAMLPAGDDADGRYASVLGGFGLAVSRHSQQPDLALDLIRWLTSVEAQRSRALALQGDPTHSALYDDPELLRLRPDYAELRQAFESAVLRPFNQAGRSYQRISAEFAAAVHRILERTAEPQAELALLQKLLERLGAGSGGRES
jgi:trehalose/maltose transport system substrate-binding protein